MVAVGVVSGGGVVGVVGVVGLVGVVGVVCAICVAVRDVTISTIHFVEH